MQMWECSLSHQLVLHRLYWNGSEICWNWDNGTFLIPNSSSHSPAQLLLGPDGCPAGERWTESSWGSLFPWWLCLSKRVMGQKGGGGETEWSRERKSKRRKRAGLRRKINGPQFQSEIISYFSCLTYVLTHFSIEKLFNEFSFPSAPARVYLSALLPLSDSQLPRRQGHSRRGTPLLRSHWLCLTPSNTGPSLLSHFLLSVLDDEDCSAAPAQMSEDNKKKAPLSLSLPLCVSGSLSSLFLVVNCAGSHELSFFNFIKFVCSLCSR